MTDLTSRELHVDGELLHVLDEASLTRLAEAAAPPGDAMARWLQWTAAKVRANREFALAWHVLSPTRPRLWLVLFHLAGRWVRIHWEHLECPACRTRSLAANPTLPDLHWGAKDEHAAREAAWQLPTVPCPKCGAAFERRAIWAAIEAPVT